MISITPETLKNPDAFNNLMSPKEKQEQYNNKLANLSKKRFESKVVEKDEHRKEEEQAEQLLQSIL